MKLASLFSGGKDSVYSLYKAKNMGHEIACLITLISKNDASYMFHVPNIWLTKLQSKALGIPIIEKETEGKKEEELADLKEAIIEAKEKYNIEGLVTGAIFSVYQSSRIQKICDELGLKCINPLWHMDQIKLLKELIENDFNVIISGMFADPFHKEWVGRKIDDKIIPELKELYEKYGLHPAGEGGEFETTVLDCPLFKKKVKILESEIKIVGKYEGIFLIKKAELVEK